MASQANGYTGKTLRIDLTTGKVSSEDTLAKYKDFIGGSGLVIRCSGTKTALFLGLVLFPVAAPRVPEGLP
jgi:hypothetical protein